MSIKPTLVNTGFGIRVDGRDTGISFPNLGEAQGGAIRLCAHGYLSVEIFDRASGTIVQHVIPNPTAA
jgi:hypothetical protein